MQSTAETPAGPLRLDVYPGAECRGELYADDGSSMAYRRRGFLRQAMRCEVGADGLTIAFGPREGTHRPWWRQVQVIVHDWSGDARVGRNGRTIDALADQSDRTLRFTIPDPAQATSVAVGRR